MANTPEIERNDELEQQLWNFAYGLLSEEEADAVQRRLDDDPEVADLWTLVKEQLDALAVATRFTGPRVRLRLPDETAEATDVRSHVAETIGERTDAERNSDVPNRRTRGFAWRSTVQWLTPLASAAVLCFALFRGSLTSPLPSLVDGVQNQSGAVGETNRGPLRLVAPRVVHPNTAYYVSFHAPEEPLHVTVENESDGKLLYKQSWSQNQGAFQLPEVEEGDSLLVKANSAHWDLTGHIESFSKSAGLDLSEDGSITGLNASEENTAQADGKLRPGLRFKGADLAELKVEATRDRIAPGTVGRLAYRIENEQHSVKSLNFFFSWDPNQKQLSAIKVPLSGRVAGDTGYQGIVAFDVPDQVVGPATVRVEGENSRGRVLLAMIEVPVEPNLVRVETWADSGVLVPGLPGRVQVRAVDSRGRGVKTRGQVVDHLGKAIVPFDTDTNGRGQFDFIPQLGEVYRLKSPDDYLISDELQVDADGFVVLAVDHFSFEQDNSTVQLYVLSKQSEEIVVSFVGRNVDDRVGVTHHTVSITEGDNRLTLSLPDALTTVNRVVGTSIDGTMPLFSKALTSHPRYIDVLRTGPNGEESDIKAEFASLAAQVIIGNSVSAENATAPPTVLGRTSGPWITAAALALIVWALCVAVFRLSRPRVWGPAMAMCGLALIVVTGDVHRRTTQIVADLGPVDGTKLADESGNGEREGQFEQDAVDGEEAKEGGMGAYETSFKSQVFEVDEGLPAAQRKENMKVLSPSTPQVVDRRKTIIGSAAPDANLDLSPAFGGGFGAVGTGVGKSSLTESASRTAMDNGRGWMRFRNATGVGRLLQEQANTSLDVETRPLARLSVGDKVKTRLTVRNKDAENSQTLGLNLQLKRSLVATIESPMMKLAANSYVERQMELAAMRVEIEELQLTLDSAKGSNVWLGTIEVVDPRVPVTTYAGGVDTVSAQLAGDHTNATYGVLWCYPSKAAEIEAVSSSLREQPVVTWDQLATLISSQALQLRWMEDANVADVDAIFAAKKSLRDWLAQAASPVWQAALPDIERSSENTRIVVSAAMAGALRDARVVANVDQVMYTAWQDKVDLKRLLMQGPDDPQSISARSYAIWESRDCFDEPTKQTAQQKISEWAVELQSAYLASLASLMTDQSDDELQELIVQGQLDSGEIATSHATATGSEGRSRSIETTALAALALHKLSRQEECDRAIAWLRTQRRNHRFGSAHATYLAFLALSQDPQNTRVDQRKMQLTSDFVFSEKTTTFTYDIPNTDGNQPIGIAFTIPTIEQCKRVQFRFPQLPSVPVELRLWEFVEGPRSTDDALSIDVQPNLERIDQETQLVVRVTAVNSSEADAERVLVTVPLPAGFEVADQGLGAQREKGEIDGFSIDPLRVLFYWEKISANGEVSCQVRLNAVATGTMTAVAPSLHRLADPERRAWDKQWRVVVE
jgi:hypothetical protein